MMIEMDICRKCGIELNDDNWYFGYKNGKFKNRICKKCNIKNTLKWIEEHPEQHKRHKDLTAKKYKEEYKFLVKNRLDAIRLEILHHYSGNPPKCACCGETILRFLTIDHINNDGKKDRELHGSGPKFHYWLVKNKFPEGYQILCYNCNSGRAVNGGICPHKCLNSSLLDIGW